MLTKLATFKGVSSKGEPLVQLFRPGDNLKKIAGSYTPEVQDFVSSYQPDPNKIALLINALGASEYWGQNVNGDIFPWDALIHDCRKAPSGRCSHPYDDFAKKIIPDYGYWTFLNAHPFVHHRNKDPSRAFGNVLVSCLNPSMKRVELVVQIDRTLAAQHDAQHVVDRIDSGEFPDVSMGCRVPYDICAVCGNKSKTRADYCSCVRELGMGRVLDDGRRVGVINIHPRFFDISFVFIGADKTAKVMQKLGSGELWVPESVRDAERLYTLPDEEKDNGLVKAASILPNIINLSEHSGTKLVELFAPERTDTPAVASATPEALMELAAKDSRTAFGDGTLRTNSGDSVDGFDNLSNVNKVAMPFLEQNRPDKVKEIYSALKRDHPDMPEEMKARIASRRGKKNATSRKSPKDGGPKYKAPITQTYTPEEKTASRTAQELVQIYTAKIKEAARMTSDELDAQDPCGGRGRFIPDENGERCELPLMDRYRPLFVADDTDKEHPDKSAREDDTSEGSDLRNVASAGGGNVKAAALRKFDLEGYAERRKELAALVKQMEDEKSVETGEADARPNRDIEGVDAGYGVPPTEVSADVAYDNQRRPEDGSSVLLTKSSSVAGDVGKGTLAGGVGGALGVGAMGLLASKGKVTPALLKSMGRAAGEWGIAGGVTNAAMNAMSKKAAAEPAKGWKDARSKKEFLELYPEEGAWMFHGSPQEFSGSVAQHGLVPDRPAVHLAYDKDRNKESKAVFFSDNPRYAAVFGFSNDKGVLQKHRFPTVYAVKIPKSEAHLLGKNEEETTTVTGSPITGSSYSFRGVIPPHRIAKVTSTSGGLRFDPLEKMEKTAEKKLQAPPYRDEFPLAGQYKWNGMTILVENPAGTWRQGMGWKTKMLNDYGEIEGSLGTDGDPVDVYMGPNEKAENVYIVHQNHVFGPKKGEYDEDKVMLGFADARAAKKAYLAHYDRPQFLRSITEMPLVSFKKMILKGETNGEKIAMEKTAEELKLEDLFNHGNTRRERVWKDKVTGKESYHVGSGLGQSFEDAKKTASAEDPLENIFKLSADKKAADKKADIDKKVDPSITDGRVVEELTDREPPLGGECLDGMAGKGLESALTTPSMMGMVLKPREFQRVMLSHAGESDMAQELDDKGVVFPPSKGMEAPCGSLSPEQFDGDIMKMLMPLLAQRSFLGPVVQRRIIRIRIVPKPNIAPETLGDSPLLSKLGAAYNWYRSEMMKVATHAPEALEQHPDLQAAVFGVDDYDIFTKHADGATIGAVLASVPLSLMYSASLRRDEQQGENLGFLQKIIADHPNLSAMGVGAVVKEVMKNEQANRVVRNLALEAAAAAKRIWTGGA